MGAAATSRPKSLYEELAIQPISTSPGLGPGPGTLETSAIETIDNDRIAGLLVFVLGRLPGLG